MSPIESRVKIHLTAVACTLFFLSSGIGHAQDDTNGTPTPPPDEAAQQQPPSNSGTSEDGATFQTFYDSLGSQGNWIQTNDYGYVWQPEVTDADWAPYTEGHWVYTDDGWTWVSDEPWGWATYHYGRWANLDGTGWVWVPGYTWAPAWVSWRYGEGYCGWAPLPPDSFVGIDYWGDGFAVDIGFHIGGDCDGFYGIGAGCYHFMPTNYLGSRSYHGHYVNRHDNFAIINRTTNVTNINVSRKGAAGQANRFSNVSAGGPSFAQVNAVSQTPIQRVNLVRSNRPGGGGAVSNNSVAFFAPQVGAATTAQPARVSRTIGQSALNRGTDITRPLAVNARLAPTPATEAQVQQARLAQSRAPAGAKVVTDGALVKPVLNAPLTTFRPMTHTFAPNAAQVQQTQVVPTLRSDANSTATPQGTSTRVYVPGATYPSSPFNQTHAAMPTQVPHTSAVPHTSSTAAPSPAATSSYSSGNNSQSTSGNMPADGSGNGGGYHSPSGGGNGGGGGGHSGGQRQGH